MMSIFLLVVSKSLISAVCLALGLALLAALLLTVASHAFFVKVDPRVAELREALPGANCGGCGYAGCEDYANAIVTAGASTSLCFPGGQSCAQQLAQIMGLEDSGERTEWIARVRCQGTCFYAKDKFRYDGIQDCFAESQLFSGHKSCAYGCLGHGNCVRACPFDAIQIVDGIAVVDEAQCRGCRRCVKACPKNLIEMRPLEARIAVSCCSQDGAKQVRQSCERGCLACRRCVRTCPVEAIVMEGNVARIQADKCVNCRKCVAVCPTHAIVDYDKPGLLQGVGLSLHND